MGRSQDFTSGDGCLHPVCDKSECSSFNPKCGLFVTLTKKFGHQTLTKLFWGLSLNCLGA